MKVIDKRAEKMMTGRLEMWFVITIIFLKNQIIKVYPVDQKVPEVEE